MSEDVQIVTAGQGGESGLFVDPGSSAEPPPEGSAFRSIALLLKGRVKWAIASCVLGLILGGAAGFLLSNEPGYRSVGMIQIKPYVPGVFNEGSPLPMFDAYIDSQVAIMQSRRTIDLAMQSPDWKKLGRGLSDESVEDFIKHLSVDRQGGIVVDVMFQDPDPKAAQIAVRSMIAAYQTIYDDANNGDASRRSQILEDLRNSYTNQLKTIKDRIQDIAGDYGSGSLDATYQYRIEELNRIESDLDQTQLDLRLAEAAPGASSPTTQPSTTMPTQLLTPEAIAMRDPVMQQNLAELAKAQGKLSLLRQSYGEGYPSVLAQQGEIRVLKDIIARRVKEYQNVSSGALQPAGPMFNPLNSFANGLTLSQLKIREESLRELDAKYKASLKDLGSKKTQIESLRADVADTQDRLDKTKARIQQLNVENQIGGRISIISDGDLPYRPFVNPKKKYTALGAFSGLAAGFGLILLIAYFDQRMKSVSDAKDRLPGNNRMLGVLPRLPDDLSNPEQASSAAYCVHHIRTILQIGNGEVPQVIAVTSPSPGDGKTSLAIALGLSFAASNARTLLIDCDFVGGGLTGRMNAIIRRKIGDVLVRLGHAKPGQIAEAVKIAQRTNRRLGEVLLESCIVSEATLHDALVQQREAILGMRDVFDGEPLANCIAPTGTHGLDILPLGLADAHHSGQFSPRLLDRILTQAREQYDTILIDTGPILGSLEACVVAATADGVVLTISRGGLRSLAQGAMEKLASVGGRFLGVVFNRAQDDDIADSGFSSPVSAHSVRQTGTDEDLLHIDRTRIGPVARAVASDVSTPSNGNHSNGVSGNGSIQSNATLN